MNAKPTLKCRNTREIIIWILTLKQWLYFDVETTSFDQRCINVEILRWNSVDFGLTLKTTLFLLWSLRTCNFSIDVEKITVFQHWNNIILSTLNQRRNLTLKERWFWVDMKKFLLLLYYDVQGIIIFIFASKWYLSFNVETTSLYQRQFNVKILRWSDVDFGLALQITLFLYVMILEGL